MNLSWFFHRRWLAIAAGVFLLATSDLVAQALWPLHFTPPRSAHLMTIAGPQALHHRPDEADPYHVRFHDVTSAAGIHFHHERAQSPQRLYPETMGAGVAWIDYDQDGYFDAFFVNSGYTPFFRPAQPPQPALYHNNRDGTFTDVTAASKIHTDGTMYFGVAVGDYDNDGYPDIYMTGYRHSVLLHNNGDGTFTDVTEKAGVGNDGNWGTAAGWFDYDRDGLLDLLVTNYVQYDVDHPVVCGDWRPGTRDAPKVSAYCHPDNFPGTSPRLYHNNGDGTFTDVTEKAGLINKDGKSLAVVLADLNNDGWPDIFIANDTQRNFLYFNNGNGTFRDASFSSGAGFSEDGRPEAGMSADAADITNNGLLYLFVSHLDFELNRLYRNNGDGTFTDYTIASGVGQSDILNSAFGARYFDFDNDGWRDLLVVNGHILDNIKLYHPEVSYEEEKKLYRNTGQGRFVEATKSQGDDFRAPRVGRGLAVGDFDNDGWQDFLVSNNGEDAQLFHNDGGWPKPITPVHRAPVEPPASAPSASASAAPCTPAAGASASPPNAAPPAHAVPAAPAAPAATPEEEDRPTLRPKPKTSAAPAATAPAAPNVSVPVAASPSQGAPCPAPTTAAATTAKPVDAGVPVSDDSTSAPRGAAQNLPERNHWIAVRLIGTKSNRDGIGAHLKLVAGDLTSYDQAKGGMSYLSAQDPRIFFGLGDHAHVDSLEIWWPSGLKETLTNLPVDLFLIIEEGKGTAKAVRYPQRPRP
jgi:enediyne biosynthesis protein E4